MRRRTLLGGIGIVALSGCVSTVESAVSSDSGPIENREFEVFESGSDFFDSISEHNPEVIFHQDGSRVEIAGKLCVGSPGRHEATLEKATYHETSDTLIAHVGSKEVDSTGNLAMTSQAYRATITFRQELPTSVVAVELGQCNVESTTTHPPTDD